MKCGTCQAEVVATDQFCQACGESLSPMESTVTHDAEVSSPEVAPSIVRFAIGCVGCFCVIWVGAAFYFIATDQIEPPETLGYEMHTAFWAAISLVGAVVLGVFSAILFRGIAGANLLSFSVWAVSGLLLGIAVSAFGGTLVGLIVILQIWDGLSTVISVMKDFKVDLLVLGIVTPLAFLFAMLLLGVILPNRAR